MFYWNRRLKGLSMIKNKQEKTEYESMDKENTIQEHKDTKPRQKLVMLPKYRAKQKSWNGLCVRVLEQAHHVLLLLLLHASFKAASFHPLILFKEWNITLLHLLALFKAPLALFKELSCTSLITSYDDSNLKLPYSLAHLTSSSNVGYEMSSHILGE